MAILQTILDRLRVSPLLYAHSGGDINLDGNLVQGILPTSPDTFNNLGATVNKVINTNEYADGPSGLRYIQFDLGEDVGVDRRKFDTIRLWHYFADGRIYHDVIIAASDVEDFSTDVSILFSNDTDNSVGFGVGQASEYAESPSGLKVKLTAACEKRYVRFYSNGSTANGSNHYVEVQLFDKSAKGNVAKGKSVSGSCTFNNSAYAVDGDKSSAKIADSVNSGLQWFQIDLSVAEDIEKVNLWHYYADGRTYHDVIVQVSNDSTFASGVTTIFNNDTNNSAGKGTGTDAEYSETIYGKKIELETAINARYLRFYSNGSSINSSNHYAEVEVFVKESDGIAHADLALNKSVITSAVSVNQSFMTNGNDLSTDYLDSYPNAGLFWAQVDLGKEFDLGRINLKHYYQDSRKYYDVIVQLSNDPTFSTGVTTVYNNDTNNSAGKGAGSDLEYNESPTGKFIDFNTVSARYIRCYSNGNSVNNYNQIVEIEAYMPPIKDGKYIFIRKGLTANNEVCAIIEMPSSLEEKLYDIRHSIIEIINSSVCITDLKRNLGVEYGSELTAIAYTKCYGYDTVLCYENISVDEEERVIKAKYQLELEGENESYKAIFSSNSGEIASTELWSVYPASYDFVQIDGIIHNDSEIECFKTKPELDRKYYIFINAFAEIEDYALNTITN